VYRPSRLRHEFTSDGFVYDRSPMRRPEYLTIEERLGTVFDDMLRAQIGMGQSQLPGDWVLRGQAYNVAAGLSQLQLPAVRTGCMKKLPDVQTLWCIFVTRFKAAQATGRSASRLLHSEPRRSPGT